MRVRVIVCDERLEEFTTKRGVTVKQQALHCKDMSVEGRRLGAELVYPMNAGEEKMWSGKLRDRYVTLDIGDLEQFGKAFKCRESLIVVGSVEQDGLAGLSDRPRK